MHFGRSSLCKCSFWSLKADVLEKDEDFQETLYAELTCRHAETEIFGNNDADTYVHDMCFPDSSLIIT